MLSLAKPGSITSHQVQGAVGAGVVSETGVPEYWILDLEGGAVDVHLDPTPSGYRSVVRHGRDAVLSLAAFPDVSLQVAAFLRPH